MLKLETFYLAAVISQMVRNYSPASNIHVVLNSFFTLCASSSATLDDLVCKFGFDETIFIFGSGSAIQSLEDDHKAVALLDVVSTMLLFGSLI